MSRLVLPTSWVWPNKAQQLLLKAIFGTGKDVSVALNRWQSLADINNIDESSNRLLPLLLWNLEKHGNDIPFRSILQGIYRKYWYQTSLVIHAGASIVHAMRLAEIPFVVMGETAMVLRYDPRLGHRPLKVQELLVSREHVFKACRRLREMGWHLREGTPKTLVNSQEAVYLSKAGSWFDLGLHWSVIPQMCRPQSQVGIWERACTCKLNGEPILVIGPTDQLLSVCVRGLEYQPKPRFDWIADAMVLIGTETIDWALLADLARKNQIILPVEIALNYLVDTLQAPVPTDTLNQLRCEHVSWSSRLEYILRSLAPSDPFRRLLLKWFHHVRCSEHSNLIDRARGFPRYIQRSWGCETIPQAFLWRLSRTWRRPLNNPGS